MTNQVLTGDFGNRKSTVMWNVRDTGNCSRKSNDEKRGKRHLTKSEVLEICSTIKSNSRYSLRDELMVLMAFTTG